MADPLADLRSLQQHAVTVDICPWCWWMAEQRAALRGGRPEDHYAAVVAEVEAEDREARA